MPYFHLILLGEGWRPGEAQLISACSSGLCRVSLEKLQAAESHAHSQINRHNLGKGQGQDLEDKRVSSQDAVLTAFLEPSFPGPKGKRPSDFYDQGQGAGHLSPQGCDQVLGRPPRVQSPLASLSQCFTCIIRKPACQGYPFFSPLWSSLRKSLEFEPVKR